MDSIVPKNFRDMSTWPTKDDINLTSNPELAVNLTNKPYESEQQYLDTQFRLVREELVRSLRDDVRIIREKKLELGDAFTWKAIRKMRIYQDIRLDDVKKFGKNPFNGLTVELSFDKLPLWHVDWMETTRLKPGTLLLLSSDCFDKSLLFSIVSNVNLYSLNNKVNVRGSFTLQLKDEDAFDFFKQRKKSFTGIEAKTYYEGVRHTLYELKRMKEIVLEKHIVGLDKCINAPSYINDDTLFKFVLPQTILTIPMIDPPLDQKEQLQKEIGLDASQFDGFFNALGKKLTLIQGPPGCGKTHVGKKILEVLLANREQSDETPILVLCYKNHALDHFLEGIIHFCSSLVRMGGRSESEILRNYRLSHLSKKMNMQKLAFNGVDSAANALFRYLQTTDNLDVMEKLNLLSLLTLLKLHEKAQNCSESDQENEEMSRDEFIRYLSALSIQCELARNEIDARDYSVIKGRQVIGMTVTCAAKRKRLLEKLKPKIVIVEEASEMLEAHLVAALPNSVEQLILIGDHQQLRPITALQGYNLEVSMFERMVNNAIPFTQLNVQHRMSTNIAGLIRVGRFYDKLTDHPSVFEHVNIIAPNLFFLQHNKSEDLKSSLDDTSISNKFEASYLIELARYFLLKGAKASDIVILVTYNAQLELINNMLKDPSNHCFHKISKKVISHDSNRKTIKTIESIVPELKVRVSTVDGFQGEESEIVLISFVRSNQDGKIGFLKESNRICVALSRAKKGLYCVGNFQAMENASAIWRRIMSYVRKEGAFGTIIELPKHASYAPGKMMISSPHELSSLNKQYSALTQKYVNKCKCFKLKHSGIDAIDFNI